MAEHLDVESYVLERILERGNESLIGATEALKTGQILDLVRGAGPEKYQRIFAGKVSCSIVSVLVSRWRSVTKLLPGTGRSSACRGIFQWSMKQGERKTPAAMLSTRHGLAHAPFNFAPAASTGAKMALPVSRSSFAAPESKCSRTTQATSQDVFGSVQGTLNHTSMPKMS